MVLKIIFCFIVICLFRMLIFLFSPVEQIHGCRIYISIHLHIFNFFLSHVPKIQFRCDVNSCNERESSTSLLIFYFCFLNKSFITEALKFSFLEIVLIVSTISSTILEKCSWKKCVLSKPDCLHNVILIGQETPSYICFKAFDWKFLASFFPK